jgi:hypothetical protein
LYDANGIPSVYTLKETLNPQFKINKKAGDLNETDIGLIAKNNGGVRISAAMISIATDCSVEEAKTVLIKCKDRGYITQHYGDLFESVYLIEKLPELLAENAAPNTFLAAQKSLSDAEIIELAVKQKGKLTASGLCLKKSISIDAAQEILDILHKKGVFDLRISDNGTIEYWLNDLSLLENNDI